MKREVRKIYPLWGILLLFSLCAVSCVDNKYNLDKDIDMTINVGGEHFTIPVGSTDTAYLSRIIKVEKENVLQPDATTRVYHLTAKNNINVNPAMVKKVTVGSAETYLTTKLASLFSSTTSGTVEILLKEKKSLNLNAEDIDEALIELGALGAETPVDLTLTFRFSGGVTHNTVTAKDLKIKFPDFLVFMDEEVKDGNMLTLNGRLTTTPKVLHVAGYRFGFKAGEGKEVVNGKISIVDNVTVDGIVEVAGISGPGSLIVSLDVTLGKMTASSVTGVIRPKIKAETAKIELNDLPDFLKDEETRLDITNPVILLKANNPLETDVEINAVLTPEKNNVNIDGHEVKVGAGYGQNKVVLMPGTNVIALSRTGECAIEGVTDNVKVQDINNLLEIIPDDIDVNLQPVIRNENYYEVELGRYYELPVGYEVDVPLSFEQNLNIVYNDSVQGLNKDLNDLDKVILKKANIILTVDNTIPLKLQLKAENIQIKDVYGNELTDVKKTIEGNKQYVAESIDGEKPVTSELVLTLNSDDTAFLSKIDRICFQITAAPGSVTGVPLKDTQWLKVTNIKVSVPGGVNVDLN